jgi:hypothetical protein
MAYRIQGLSPEPFKHLFGLPDEELAKQGVVRGTWARKSCFSTT